MLFDCYRYIGTTHSNTLSLLFVSYTPGTLPIPIFTFSPQIVDLQIIPNALIASSQTSFLLLPGSFLRVCAFQKPSTVESHRFVSFCGERSRFTRFLKSDPLSQNRLSIYTVFQIYGPLYRCHPDPVGLCDQIR